MFSTSVPVTLLLKMLGAHRSVNAPTKPCLTMPGPFPPFFRTLQLCELCLCSAVAAVGAGGGPVPEQHRLWQVCQQREGKEEGFAGHLMLL
jgi:hypothetical protein